MRQRKLYWKENRNKDEKGNEGEHAGGKKI